MVTVNERSPNNLSIEEAKYNFDITLDPGGLHPIVLGFLGKNAVEDREGAERLLAVAGVEMGTSGSSTITISGRNQIGQAVRALGVTFPLAVQQIERYVSNALENWREYIEGGGEHDGGMTGPD